ncbi:hypothetical protein BH11PSE11_BH11PSE11_13570 [soil metagenome]
MQDLDAITRYVDAAAALHGLPMNAEQRQRVINTFALNAGVAAALLAFPLPAEVEAAPVFRLDD